jgi:taurine dioxygenase
MRGGRVARLSPLAAEVAGIDLGQRKEGDFALVQQALDMYPVVVVPKQRVSDEELRGFASYFGTVAPSPVGYVRDTSVDGIYDVDGSEFRASMWHTDLTFESSPMWLGILAAKSLPKVGGDTLWSDMSAAYARLSPLFSRWLLTLDAEHSSAGMSKTGDPSATWIHPVVISRPRTCEPVLYVNPLWTRRIVGLEASESRAVLSFLCELATTTPEITYRHRWLPGDVVVWDMRSTLHRVVDDFGTDQRVLRRVSVLNEPPARFTLADIEDQMLSKQKEMPGTASRSRQSQVVSERR